jgi:hypothetical protein
MSHLKLFFDRYPEFLDTSGTASDLRRLNLRHVMMIERHRKLFDGKRVVDIASHDGRWSFAVLEANAAHVTGIEGRAELVDKANKTFADKGVASERFDFIEGDAHEVLAAGVGKVDVVLCLGFFYHTLRYPELLAGIRSTGAKYLIMDTRVLSGVKESVIRVRTDPTGPEKMAIEDKYSQQGQSLVGTPSVSALENMLAAYDYEVVAKMDWRRFLRKRNDVHTLHAYADGSRVTYVARLKAGAGRAGPAISADQSESH